MERAWITPRRVLLLMGVLWTLQTMWMLHSSSPSAVDDSIMSLGPFIGTMPNKNGTSNQSLITTESSNATSLLSLTQNGNLLLAKFNPVIEKMWKCFDPDAAKNGREKKLVFVHVFKTAGSTFRRVFFMYALHCHLGISIVARCSHLSSESMMASSTGRWKSGNDLCHRTGSVDRNGKELRDGHFITNSFLRKHMDLLIGHLPLGVNWPSKNNNSTVDVQYITFFREPVQKYVSGVIYVKKDKGLSFEEIVAHIKSFVRHELSIGAYREGYSAYLLTPDQNAIVYDKKRKNKPSIDQRINLIMSNLVNYPVIIGIVEKMSSSLDLIMHTINVDGNKEVTNLFQHVDSEKSAGNSTERLVLNKSSISTTKVVEELRQDTEFFSLLQEYLKYDAMLYSFALQLHDRQYKWLESNRLI